MSCFTLAEHESGQAEAAGNLQRAASSEPTRTFFTTTRNHPAGFEPYVRSASVPRTSRQQVRTAVTQTAVGLRSLPPRSTALQSRTPGDPEAGRLFQDKADPDLATGPEAGPEQAGTAQQPGGNPEAGSSGAEAAPEFPGDLGTRPVETEAVLGSGSTSGGAEPGPSDIVAPTAAGAVNTRGAETSVQGAARAAPPRAVIAAT